MKTNVFFSIGATFAVLAPASLGADRPLPCWSKNVPALTPENINSGKIKALAIESPRPDYPKYARERHWGGTGCYVMHIDNRTGFVKCGEILQSAGHRILDEAVVAAFRRWKFKPGALSGGKVACPVTFDIRTAQPP
jgi:TonB family protein